MATQAAQRIRILLADDHALVRAGLKAILEASLDFEVVGEVADSISAVRVTAEQQPDVVLLDISMPGMNGLDAIGELRAHSPDARIVVLSMHADDEYVRRAFQAGAVGYVPKVADPGELELAIRAVVRGDHWISPSVTRGVVAADAQGLAPEYPRETLTSRQREVLRLVAEGHSTKEIARQLGLSVKTIETHRTQIMERLDIHGVAGLVRYAVRTGLVAP